MQVMDIVYYIVSCPVSVSAVCGGMGPWNILVAFPESINMWHFSENLSNVLLLVSFRESTFGGSKG